MLSDVITNPERILMDGERIEIWVTNAKSPVELVTTKDEEGRNTITITIDGGQWGLSGICLNKVKNDG